MVSPNPYAPPSIESDGATLGTGGPGSGEPLFTDTQVALATFFGSPMAGFVVLALNERRMGRSEQLGKMIGLGVVVSVIVIAIALVMPAEVPGFVVTLGYLFGMREGAKRWQGEEIMERLSNGTPKGSNWIVFGIGMACFVPIVLVIFAIAFMYPSLLPG